MPIYLFENKKTLEVKEVVQPMNDEHTYSENGVAWQRIYTVPQAGIDTKIDPWSSKSFVEKTRDKGTLGSLFDRAKELGLKRADKNGGVDPLAAASKQKREDSINMAKKQNNEAIKAHNQKLRKQKQR